MRLKEIAGFSSGAALALLAGCFTMHETPYPAVAAPERLPESADVSVRLSGFKAEITEYVPVYGYETMYVDGWPYRRGGRYTTVSTHAYVPQTRASEAFLLRAQEALETGGFVLKAATPKYLADVSFAGPFVSEGERWAQGLWLFCSLLSADYGVQTWTAKLKIYDNSTGKVIFHRDYVQRYQVVVWGPLPLFSPASSSKNDSVAMQSWCLTALTDKAVADISSFLRAR